MDTPLFSIITPSYNYATYVRECIESVKNQEGVTFEHIVFDAGSTDGTLDILREYPHLDVTVEPDQGMSDAINKGFRKAKGKWVMWLNSDDRLLPGALKAVAAFAEKHPEADVVYGAWNFVDADGAFVRAMKALPFSVNMLIEHGCYIASTALFLRRSTTIDEGFLLNVKFRYVMDGEYYARLGRAGKRFVNFNKPLADFRQHEAALSSRRLADNSIDANLRRLYQFSEPAAIRRTYGWSPFNNPRWNLVLDAFLYEIYRVKKGFLKLTTSWANA
jgi:glycosyltransferase involved in cell wall biosynthesis